MAKKKEKQTKKHTKNGNNNGNYTALNGDEVVTKTNKLFRRLKRGTSNSWKEAVAKKIYSSSANTVDVAFRKALQRDGTRTVVEMASDGNCLFRALSDQLFVDHGYRHDQVRTNVCDFMEQHQDEFSGFLVLDETESDHDAQDFASYIAAMRGDAEWGGNLELVAAAKCYSRNITVFSAPLAALTIVCGEGVKTSGPDLQLSYHDNDHYNSVRPTNGKMTPIQPLPPVDPPLEETPPVETPPSVELPPVEMPLVSNEVQSSVSPPEQGRGDAVEVQLSEAKEDVGEQGEEDQEDEVTGSETTDESNPSTHDMPMSQQLDKVDADSTSQEGKETGPSKDKVPKKNDSCPCGSGLRYKKCCWAKEKHLERLKKLHGEGEEEETTTTTNKLLGDNNDELTMDGHFRVLKI